MNSIATITTFLGWCSVINIGLLGFSALLLVMLNSPIKKLHSALMRVDPDALNILYLDFLGYYKLAIIMLNLVPYFAWRIQHRSA